MTEPEVEERVYRRQDGYDVAKVMDELEAYTASARAHGFSALLGRDLVSTEEVRARFRLPAGKRLGDAGPGPKAEAFRRLIHLEATIPTLFEHTAPGDVFVTDEQGHVVLHAPLIGWHRPAAEGAVRRAAAWWAALVPTEAPGSDEARLRSVGTFAELAAAMEAAGIAVPAMAELSLEERTALLRKRAVDILAHDAESAAKSLIEALRLTPSREVLHLSLHAAAAANRVDLYDEAKSLVSRLGGELDADARLALDAWRACRGGDLSGAESKALAAVRAGVGVERAREVLIEVYERARRHKEALDQWTTLLRDFPSPGRLSRALQLALEQRDVGAARRILATYSLPVTDVRVLLVRAQLQTEDGDDRACLATLASAAAGATPMTEQVASRLTDQARRALRKEIPLERASRMLSLVESLLRRLPGNGPLCLERARWLLAANFDRECQAALEGLPPSPDREHLAAICAFRRGDFRGALAHGEAALRGGVADPDLVSTMATACVQADDRAALAALSAAPVVKDLLARYPTLATELRTCEGEIDARG